MSHLAKMEARRPNFLSRAAALAKTECETIINTTVCRRHTLFAGGVARVGARRLPKIVMFGNLVGAKGYFAGQGI